MVKAKKLVILAVALVLVFSLLGPAAAYADGLWISTVVEQTRANAPDVNMYFYPLDVNSDIVLGLSGANTTVRASLGNETLQLKSLSGAKDEGTLYIVAVNTSAPDTGFGYLQSVMNSLKYWLDGMSEKDRMMLISYTDVPTVLLDGTENRTAAVTGIESLATDTAKTDAVLAIKKAIELSQNAGEGFPERHVLVMFDDGKFLTEDKVNLENILASLLDAKLPLYALGHEKMYTEDFLTFAINSNGAGIQTNGYSCEDEAKIVKSYIDSAYVAKFAAPTNKLTPRERHMDVYFGYEGLEHELSFSVVVDKHIPDTTAPLIEKAEFGEENELKVWFSEDVLGADKVSSYVLKNASDKEIVIEKAEYDRNEHSAVLKLKTAPSSGKHTLQLPGITDNSEEKNPVAFSGNDKWYTIDAGSGKLIIWIAAGAAVVVAAAVAAAVVLSKKRKEQEEAERQRRIEEEARANERNKAQFDMINQRIDQVQNAPRNSVVDANTRGIAATLNVALPNGMKKKHQIVVNGSYVVGRKTDKCDYAIADEKMSSRHFSLSVSFDKLMISDLNSTNGTYVNGIKIDRPRMLQSGDTVVAGGTKIIISF